MRMSTFKFITYFLVAMALSSCSNQEKNIPTEEEELLSFDVSTLDNKEYEIKLSDLMESVEIIRMDTVQEAFTKIFRVAVSENYFAIHHVNHPVKLYNRKNGKFLGNIGRKGNGPGEYVQVWNVEIDEPTNRIYLVNNNRNVIYSYDINGKFYGNETIRLSEGNRLERGKVFFNKNKDRIIIFYFTD